MDVLYSRAAGNLERIVRALAPLKPYLRGAPKGLPFRWELRTLQNGLNFTLVTEAGELDLLAEVAGGGAYDSLLAASEKGSLWGLDVRVVSLGQLIYLKRAAGRPRDLEAIAELEKIQERLESD